jgi:hypothetical protein
MINKKLIAAVCLSLTAASTSALTSTPKHVAVAPENAAKQKLVSAQQQGIFSHSTMMPVYLSKSTNRLATNDSVSLSLPFDGEQQGSLIFLSPNAEQWQVSIADSQGKLLANEQQQTLKRLASESISIGQQDFKGRQFPMAGASKGTLNITISSTKQKASQATNSLGKQPKKLSQNGLVDNNQPIGFLMFKGDVNFKLYSHLDNNYTTLGSQLNLSAYMVNDFGQSTNRQKQLSQQVAKNTIDSATLTITSPSNKTRVLKLLDNGRNGDKLAGDGRFGANLPTNEIGNYTTQLQVTGIRPDGFAFSRTINDIYPIASSPYQFKGSKALLSFVKSNQTQLSIPVISDLSERSVYLSGEVWGTNQQGQLQLASWVGGLASAKSANRQTSLDLNFDTRWITRLNLKAPFYVRSLRLQDANNHVPVAKSKPLSLQLSHSVSRSLKQQFGFNGKFGYNSMSGLNGKSGFNSNSNSISQAITDDMRMSNAPAIAETQSKATSNPKLLLVHGYCSSSVWNTGNFSNSVEFQDFSKNRSHEAFAQQILNFGNSYTSYGIVAHSQGGAAALHLYSRYWSGLDYATGGRIIQSVGTPYQGTALAGNLAILGSIFGAGCGTNTDLTYSGASNWLSTIPSWARSQVDYYTTSFSTKWWRYDYCNIATDLFLNDPEDGTTEQWAGQLSGAANMGHKKGWCHTRGMRDTAQFLDSGRNSSMNSRAAR